MTTGYTHATCTMCGKHDYVGPLHGERGGPLCCLLCSGKWYGEHGRRRRLGRIVIRAMQAFLDGGGRPGDIDKLKGAALCDGLGITAVLGIAIDPLGYLADGTTARDENIELTRELLADAIRLSHPDQHPPERRELAHRVTQQLLKLQPFTFPARKPKPAPPPSRAPCHGSIDISRNDAEKPLRYPCPTCADASPPFYCDSCKAEWRKRQQQQFDKEAEKRRAWYARRKERRLRTTPPTTCVLR